MRKPFVLVVLLLAFLGCEKKAVLAPDAKKFGDEWSEKIFAVRSELDKKISLRTDLAFFGEMKTWSAKKAEEPSGVQGALFDAISQFYDKGRDWAAKTVDAVQRFEDAGGADFQALLEKPDKATIENRAILIAELETALQAMATFESRASMEFRNEISKTITDAQIINDCEEVFINFTSSLQRNKNRETDAEYCAVYRAAIQLVLEDWPDFEKWTAENGNGPFSFSSPAYVAKWDALMKRLLDAKRVSQQN